MGKILHSIAYLALITLPFLSCNKFSGDQTVPAYIQIDSIPLVTNYSTEGSNSASIVDAWVFVDQQLIGAFEMPALIPVLSQGAGVLTIRPGIKLNGITQTRVWYPYFEFIEITDFDFIPGETQKVQKSTRYFSETTVFVWMEDFESANFSLNETGNSNTEIKRTSPANNPDAFLDEYSAYSGQVVLTEENDRWEAEAAESFQLPGLGTPVILELDYKTTVAVTVGLFIESEPVLQRSVLVINPSASWNKIYVNFTPAVSENFASASGFKPYFQASHSGIDDDFIYLDNIKLLTQE